MCFERYGTEPLCTAALRIALQQNPSLAIITESIGRQAVVDLLSQLRASSRPIAAVVFSDEPITEWTVKYVKAGAMDLMYLAHINVCPVDGGRLVYSTPADATHMRVRASIPTHVNPRAGYAEFLEALKEHPEQHQVLKAGMAFDPEVVFFIDYQPDKTCSARPLQLHPDGSADVTRQRMPALNHGMVWISRTPASVCSLAVGGGRLYFCDSRLNLRALNARSGKPLWASEEWSQSGGQWGNKGALYVARLMNKLYTRDRITKYEIWCPIDSIYDQIIWADTGALQADTTDTSTLLSIARAELRAERRDRPRLGVEHVARERERARRVDGQQGRMPVVHPVQYSARPARCRSRTTRVPC